MGAGCVAIQYSLATTSLSVGPLFKPFAMRAVSPCEHTLSEGQLSKGSDENSQKLDNRTSRAHKRDAALASSGSALEPRVAER